MRDVHEDILKVDLLMVIMHVQKLIADRTDW